MQTSNVTQASKVVLHPAVLRRDDWEEALNIIESECGPITIGNNGTTLDIHCDDPEPAA